MNVKMALPTFRLKQANVPLANPANTLLPENLKNQNRILTCLVNVMSGCIVSMSFCKIHQTDYTSFLVLQLEVSKIYIIPANLVLTLSQCWV